MRLPHVPEGSMAQTGRALPILAETRVTSPVKTASQARPPSPASSGFVRSFLSRSNTAPLVCVLLRGDPILVEWGTLTWCQWPTATMSNHLPQLPTCPRQVLHCRLVPLHTPRGNLFDPEPLLAHTLLDDGHGCPRGGHIGRCANTEEWGVGGVDTGRLRTTANRSCTPCSLGVLSMAGHTVTSGEPDPPGRGLDTPGSRRMCRQRLAWLFAATLFSVETVQSLPLVVGVEILSNFPTPGCRTQLPSSSVDCSSRKHGATGSWSVPRILLLRCVDGAASPF